MNRFLLGFLIRFLFPYREELLPETLAETYYITRNQLSFCFYVLFLSVADLSATDYGIAAECSLSVCVSVCVACQPLKSCEVSLRFF